MKNAKDCVIAYKNLLNIKYVIILGRKNIVTTINLTFDKNNCFHLMGLQYLRDQTFINFNREKVFDKIANDKISVKQIETSDFYDKIKERIHYFAYLEALLDSNDTIFKYNKNRKNFSKIEADYFMVNELFDKRLYLFLSKDKNNDYFLRSFFPEQNTDYTINQAKWTLLFKKKINLVTNEETILYDKLQKI